MKAFIILSLVAAAWALPVEVEDLPVPVEDVPEVAEARAEFMKAFETAEMGKHSALAPEPVATAYLADTADVEAAKAEFMAAFEDAEMGKHAELAPKAAMVKASEMPVVQYAAHPFYYHAMPYYYNTYPAVQYKVEAPKAVEVEAPKVVEVEAPKVHTYTHTYNYPAYTYSYPAYTTYNLGYPYVYNPVAVKPVEAEESAVETA